MEYDDLSVEFGLEVLAKEASVIDNDLNLRFRRDIIDEYACSSEQIEALNELDCIIYNSMNIRKIDLPKNSLLLMNNGKFLHARTSIKDKNRHLRRVRFNFK